MRNLTAAVLVIVFSSCTLWGQGDRGMVRGTVRDSSGGVIPNATVSVQATATNADFKTTTTGAGEFTAPSLPTGVYRVRVESAGFKTMVQDNILVQAGDAVTLELRMEVGTTQETVEVRADATILQTDSARVATQISTKLVSELPVAVNGGVRSPFDLAGVTGDVTRAGGTDGALRVGGGREGAFGMTLDGTSITVALNGGGNVNFVSNNTPSVEALQEFAVESSGFKAEMGHASGGAVSFVSKSGSNAFHGSVYEFFRNEVMDARGFFAGSKKPVLRQSDFGVTAGGPVVIPKIYNGHDKTFFFFSYEGFRNRAGSQPVPISVPSAEMYDGNFGNWVNANNQKFIIYDPNSQVFANNAYTRTAFPNNVIPPTMIDPVARPILAFTKPLAAANVAGLVPGTSAYVRNNFLPKGDARAPNNKWNVKFDQVITTNQRVNFYYGYGRRNTNFGPSGPDGLPAPLSGTPGFNRSGIYRGNYDYTIRPNLLNRLSVGVNRFDEKRGSLGLKTGAPLSDGLETQPTGWKSRGICIPNYPDCDGNYPVLNFGGDFGTWGVASTAGSRSNIIEVRDDLTWIKGEHTFKMGYFYNDSQYVGLGSQNIAGNATFNYQGTSLPGSTNQATGGGSGFASFLLGYVNNYSLDTARYIGTHYSSMAGYFQDDWRVNSKLTLNLGLRLEGNIAPTVDDDQQSDLDLNKPNPGADGIKGALVFAGSGTGRDGRRALIPSWFGLAPRTGLSYAMDSKTVIRASAGLGFGPIVQAANSSHNLGFIQRITATNTSQGINPLWYLKNGPPAYSSLPNLDPAVGNGSNAPFWNGNSATRPSAELNYAFDIQRQVTQSFQVDVGWVATLASRIQSSLLTFNALNNYPSLPANLSPFTAAGRTLLNSQVGSAAANAAGIRAPFSAFNSLWGTGATVGQSIRPFPQYAGIDTTNGGGDRIGHSTYHALQFRFTKRLAGGVTLQGNYNFSKYLTDYENTPMDPLNRRLEKTLAANDQTHSAKFVYSIELPFGKGRKFGSGSNALVNGIIGGWRLAGNNSYISGPPVVLTTTVSFPLFAGTNHPTISTYNGWRGAEASNGFDPFANSFYQPVSFFGPQPTDRFGNATRANPKARDFASLNENISMAKEFRVKEAGKIEFRAEAFNMFNRTRFGALANANSLQNANFGKWQSQANTPRQMQLTLKVSW